MKRSGKMLYVPVVVLDELAEIKGSLQVSKNAAAFERMAKYAQVGREAERIKNLDFLWMHRGRRRR